MTSKHKIHVPSWCSGIFYVLLAKNSRHDLHSTTNFSFFQEMLATARQFTKRPEHSKAHSCIVVVMTHGEYDQLIGVDGSTICTHEFTALFNSANAPLLAGKPKFFIIQACRGG